MLDFGDYCNIEQHRFGADNEMYQHKVIGRLRSNGWVDVPVKGCIEETIHDQSEEVVNCIICGIDERYAFRYRGSDVNPV